jgi:2-polyprenyl-3-methyl-5-hydroxy-6-metoxy-1,4-benzoquinol methylase
MWPLLKEWEPCLAKVAPAHLDVGCAEGDLGAAALRDGWAVSGVEPASWARQKAAGRGLRTFATLDDVAGSYGLITMFHVLEHMIDPLSALSRAREVIAEDGLLVVELPQWGSLGRRVRRSQWAQLKPPEHINFFNARSLSYALRAAGWQVARCVTIQERPFALAATALRRRQIARTVAYAAGGAIVERFGLGGYLRTSAIPDGRSATVR